MVLLGGQFKSATHGQFKSAQGGHFDRILQPIELLTIKVMNPNIYTMNCIEETFRKTFEDTLDKLGNFYQRDVDNIYSIAPNNKPYQITIAKLIGSEPIMEKLHGSINDTEIKAIGYFRFKLAHENIEPNFYIFAFSNNPDNKVEFVIIPYSELKNRLNQRKCITGKDQETKMRLWLLPDDLVFETTNFGAEGEWWLIAGAIAENTLWYYTSFLNGWDHLL